MKIITIITALAALPLMAQEPAPATAPQQPMPCSCPRQQCDAAPKCPQAAMAAAFGFQRGYHMGFEAGFAEAIHISQKAGNCGKGCGRPGKEGKHGRPEGPRPTPPQQQQQSDTAPTPQPPAAPASPAPAEQAVD